MKKLFKPFESLPQGKRNLIIIGWIAIILLMWISSSSGDTHLFPTPAQVGTAFKDLFILGLFTHVFYSLTLCFSAIVLASFLSLFVAYASPLPMLKPLAIICSKFRYLPLTGISFYMALMFKDGRNIQIGILVIFMATFMITSLLAMIADISNEEYDHARTLGCSRWEMLWEVVIKGRLDYVIEIIRQNLAIVWVMLVMVEGIVISNGGVGFLIKNADKMMSHSRIVALQIVILLIGLALDQFLTFTRKSIFRYSK